VNILGFGYGQSFTGVGRWPHSMSALCRHVFWFLCCVIIVKMISHWQLMHAIQMCF